MNFTDYYMLYGFVAVVGGLTSDKTYLLWMGLAMQSLALISEIVPFIK
jgi:hypothetical protein